MHSENYSSSIQVTTSPERVFQAITQEIDQWWTESSNSISGINDQLTVRFEKNTCWVMRVSELQTNQCMSWEVIEAHHVVENVSRSDEWQGTQICWEIILSGKQTQIRLTHQGLTPRLECYEICHAGWDYFLQSLKSYLETGRGTPYRPNTN